MRVTILLITLGLIWPSSALSETTPTIEITEVYYDAPGSDTGEEWLEIANLATSSLTITTGSGTGSWRVFDTSNHTFTLTQGSATLAPNEVAIIAQDPARFASRYPTYTGTVFKSAISLPNSSATLKLSADRGTSWFHERGYAASLGAAGDGHTLEWATSGWQPSDQAGGTPGSVWAEPPPTPTPLPILPFSRAGPVPHGTTSPSPVVIPNPIISPPSLPPLLVFTEIHYNPAGSDTDHEWLELQDQGLDRLTISSGTTSASWRVRTGDGPHTLTHRQGDSTLSPGDYLVISEDADQFLLDYPGFSGRLYQSAISLRNTNQIVALSLDGGASWLAEIMYDTAAGGNGDGRTLTRSATGVWASSSQLGGTPGQAPAAAAAAPTPKLVINEFVPRPAETTSEWIELINLDTQPIDLTGWMLDDSPSGSTKYTFTDSPRRLLAPGELLVLTRDEIGLVLGNAKDEVRLLEPSGHVIMTVPYGTTPTNAAWMRDTVGAWRLTALPTPGSANQLLPIVDLKALTKVPKIPKAKQLKPRSTKKTAAAATKRPVTTQKSRVLIRSASQGTVSVAGSQKPAAHTWTKWLPWIMLGGVFLGITHLSLQKVTTLVSMSDVS